MSALSDFRADLQRYPRSAWITHRAIWAIAAYRFARWADQLPQPARLPLKALSVAITLFARVTTNIELPTRAEIGPGLRIGHAGPIVVSETSKIGRNCTMGVGIVLGARADSPQAPIVGDDCRFGAYAVALGPITIGDRAFVGAMSLVIHDVEPGMIVAGVPAKSLRLRREGE